MLLKYLFRPNTICRRWKTIRVACASGFWGDTAVSTPQLVYGTPKVDYIVYDYLSEITMSLLARMRLKDPKAGFCPDFIAFHLVPYLKEISSKRIKIISNAGGLNPLSCAEALTAVARQQGLPELKVCVVTGDDILSEDKWLEKNAADLDTGKSLNSKATKTSLNVYFGAAPIAKALELGADIVITGRCADSSLVLGPLMHEFKWSEHNYQKLALGSLAGHLVECGAQVTGGICTDWQANASTWHKIGFPIVEFDGGDSFVVTKPKDSGGNVNFGTVAEQMVYEIGDPASYLLPDVTVDMRNVTLKENRTEGSATTVIVTGVEGKKPTATYKASGSYVAGYRCVAVCPVIGPNAKEKAEATANAILKRSRDIFKKLKMDDFTQTNIQILGSEQSYGSNKRQAVSTRECVLWLGVQHSNKTALELFSREIAPAGTGMAPGLTNIVGGRPTVSPVLRLCSFLVPKEIESKLYMNNELVYTYNMRDSSGPPSDDSSGSQNTEIRSQSVSCPKGSNTIPLHELAYARSGDKGDTANIGIVCRHSSFYPYLKEQLTEKFVAKYFAHFLSTESTVKRFELNGINGLNFVLSHSLGGGGIASLRCDPQGKAYAQMLLDANLENLPSIDEMKSKKL